MPAPLGRNSLLCVHQGVPLPSSAVASDLISRSRGRRRRPQSGDQHQDFPGTSVSTLRPRPIEGDVAGVAREAVGPATDRFTPAYACDPHPRPGLRAWCSCIISAATALNFAGEKNSFSTRTASSGVALRAISGASSAARRRCSSCRLSSTFSCFNRSTSARIPLACGRGAALFSRSVLPPLENGRRENLFRPPIGTRLGAAWPKNRMTTRYAALD